METWNKHTKLHAYKLGLLKIQEAMRATNKSVESSNQFISVFTNSSPINSPDLGPSLHLPMEDIAVNIFSVTELLRYLKSHKATWLIQFNPSKCQVVRVTTKQESISDSYTTHHYKRQWYVFLFTNNHDVLFDKMMIWFFGLFC